MRGVDEKCMHISSQKLKGHLGDLNIDGKIILKWIVKAD
jgi:hypothetical protein